VANVDFTCYLNREMITASSERRHQCPYFQRSDKDHNRLSLHSPRLIRPTDLLYNVYSPQVSSSMSSLQPLAVYQLVLHPVPLRKGMLPSSPPESPPELLYALNTLSDRYCFSLASYIRSMLSSIRGSPGLYGS
jgi:hypothetical protein